MEVFKISRAREFEQICAICPMVVIPNMSRSTTKAVSGGRQSRHITTIPVVVYAGIRIRNKTVRPIYIRRAPFQFVGRKDLLLEVPASLPVSMIRIPDAVSGCER